MEGAGVGKGGRERELVKMTLGLVKLMLTQASCKSDLHCTMIRHEYGAGKRHYNSK